MVGLIKLVPKSHVGSNTSTYWHNLGKILYFGIAASMYAVGLLVPVPLFSRGRVVGAIGHIWFYQAWPSPYIVTNK